MDTINRRLFLVKCGTFFSVLPNMLAAEQVDNSCGLPIMNDRELAFWDDTADFPSGFRITSMEKYNKGCVLRIAILDRKNGKYLYFFSMDNGQSWQLDDSEMKRYGNLNKFPSIANVASNNARTLFWRNSSIYEILVSEDMGKSWKRIEMPSNIQDNITNIELSSVSPHDDNRIYVRVRFPKAVDDDIYLVDHRVKSFVKVAHGVLHIVESRATPKIFIGVARFKREGWTPTEIVTSKDGGISWNEVSHNIVTNYYYIGETASPIQKSPSDRLNNIIDPVMQIETDPVDPDTFYVVTWTGVFVTHNFGESFKLLPISHEYIRSIEEIAVNPVDGRHIFASVKKADLYHSDDRGCSWKKLTFPKV